MRRLVVVSLTLIAVVLVSAGDEEAQKEPVAATAQSLETAVTESLDWLARHQRSNGSWESAAFTKRCKSPKQPCANASDAFTTGRGFQGYDAGVTGLALLAFVEAGHHHKRKDSPYKKNVEKAVRWLLKQRNVQGQSRGRLGKTDAEEWVYNHAIGTTALAQLLLVSEDTGKLQKPVQQGVEYCLRSRNEGYGWKYESRDGKNDTSVTAWMCQALMAANACNKKGLVELEKAALQDAYVGIVTWFERVTSQLSFRTGYMSPGDPGSQLQGIYGEPFPYSKELSPMTAAAIYCRGELGQKGTDELIVKGLALIAEHAPVWDAPIPKQKSRTNLYYWYYGTKALGIYQPEAWPAWRAKLYQALLSNQREERCEKGSWDPVGEWGGAGGRVYSTAIGSLTLSVAMNTKDRKDEPEEEEKK